MISAIAARKAAQAELQKVPDTPHVHEQVTSTSEETPRSTSKRKAPPQDVKSVKKKRVKKEKEKRAEVPKERYFTKQKDEFKEQEDLIVVDSDGEDEDGVEMSEDSDLEPGPSFTSSKAKRKWSPSRMVEDSSEESSAEASAGPELDLSPFFPRSARQPVVCDENRILSTFQPTPDQNMFVLTAEEVSALDSSSQNVGGTILIFTPADSLCILGACLLNVIHGSISLCGSTLHSSGVAHRIYAPRSSPLPIIRHVASGGSITDSIQLPQGLDGFPPNSAVILLRELRTGVDGLGQICRPFEGAFEPSKWQKGRAEAPFDIPGLYMVTHQTKDVQPFTLSPSWEEALTDVSSCAESPLVGTYLIKGPKNSGKSTFCRALLNRLLTLFERVAYLECDIGQSEFTPGGMVALNVISEHQFGPPFTHQTLPNVAHFIGATTPRSSPSHYLDSVAALLQFYRLDIQNPSVDYTSSDEPGARITDSIPLIVNSMGWVKGLGADLTQKIEDLLIPTDIFDIQPSLAPEQYGYSEVPPTPIPNARNQYQAYHGGAIADQGDSKVHIVQGIPSSTLIPGFTAADHRAMSILSYFHAVFPSHSAPGELGQVTVRGWDTTKPLCAVPPYEVDASVALDKVVLTGAGSEDVVPEEVGRVLNGAIVGVVKCEPGTLVDYGDVYTDGEDTGEQTSGIRYTRHLTPPSPSSSNCVGLALIRAVAPHLVDHESASSSSSPPAKPLLHVLTPLPPTLLSGARVFVKGEMELPVWGMLDFRSSVEGDVAGVERAKVPYLQWGKGGEGVAGADKRRVRRNLMRRSQM